MVSSNFLFRPDSLFISSFIELIGRFTVYWELSTEKYKDDYDFDKELWELVDLWEIDILKTFYCNVSTQYTHFYAKVYE